MRLRHIILTTIYHYYKVTIHTINIPNSTIFFKLLFILLTKKNLRKAGIKHALTYIAFKQVVRFSNKYDYKIFLFDGSLLGAYRGQNCGAGSSQDLDIGIVIREKNIEELLRKINKFFNSRARLVLKKNKLYIDFLKLHNYIYPIDLQLLLIKKKVSFKPVYFKKTGKKIVYLDKKDIFPLKKTKFYNQNFLLPNNSKKIIKITYGNKWKILKSKSNIFF